MNKSALIHKIESYIPSGILEIYRESKRYIRWKMQQIANMKAVCKLRKKQGPMNVVFINVQHSAWKYDSLFNLMLKDERFNPTILVCPLEGREESLRIPTMKETFAFFQSKGYPTICAYNEANGEYVDIETLSPDMIFYQTEYPNQTEKRYNHYTLRRYLKCYVNYAYISIPGEWSIASAVHGLMWRYFSECESNRKLCFSYNKREFSKNMRVTGYPIFDEYQKAIGEPTDWKDPNPKFKRIIWAPHHTIEGNTGLLHFSTFMLYHEKMLELAEKYKEKVQFVFKPHPLLKSNLYEHPDWGKERTDAYYTRWEKGENTAFVNGNYMNLFKSSDGIMHDSGSFLVEYLYTQKPGLYLGNYDREAQSNEVGKRAYRCYYLGKSVEDIEAFILRIIEGKDDTLADKRKAFYNEVLLPPNGKSVAENMLDEIVKGIYGQATDKSTADCC